MSKHPPRPATKWTFKLKNAGNGFMVSDDSGNMCDVFMTNDPEIAEARARLITAAPDLLNACKEAVFLFAHGVGAMTSEKANSDRNIEVARKIKAEIKAAIAKAEGR